MKQVANDIHAMTDEELNTYIAAHIQQMERGDKELYANQLEAGYWRKISQPKRPPEAGFWTWYVERKKELDAINFNRRFETEKAQFYNQPSEHTVGHTHD